jgi:tRNA A37 threonylcarbamoyladenosine dehydratase
MKEASARLPIAPHEVEDDYKLHRRFDRMGRLVGDAGMERLFRSKVVIIGLGGVGSFAAESLARSGIGHLSLVDFDLVCVTNSNRQIQAVKGAVGKQKADVLADRLRLVNPQAEVDPVRAFYSKETSEELLGGNPDFVVDAIDNITAKCHLIATCKERGIPIISSTGASGRMDPTALAVADLAETKVDPLANAVREILRKKYGFPQKGSFGVPAVYSTEAPRSPEELHYDHGQGFRCVCPNSENGLHECEKRAMIYGTASFVTGAFGLACAGVVVRALTGR